jgi:prepilin-type N-terminal cleavage/methylation domain-containing protein
MSKLKRLQNDTGFTLIEIIGVLVILAFLASLAVPRYIDLENNVKQNAIDAVTSEINARENLTWSNHKISNSGFVSDVKIFGELNLNFDSNYTWNSGDPKPSGGTLQFKGESFTFSRTASTYIKPAVWKRN